MARLPRVKQKIFAGTAAVSQITAFGTIKSGTPVYATDAADIMNANFEAGWSAAIDGDYAPYRQDRNAVDTVTTQQIAYILQEGIAEWNADTVYYNGSVAKLIDGTSVKFYLSIADNNTSTLNDTTKWVMYLNISNTGKIFIPGTDFVDLLSNQTINSVKTFLSSPIIPTPATSDNSTKAASTAFVKNSLQSCAGYPDYTARVAKNSETDYTAEFDGLLYVYGTEGYNPKNVVVNGVEYTYIYHYGSGYSSGVITIYLKEGDTFRVQAAGSNSIYLIPLR